MERRTWQRNKGAGAERGGKVQRRCGEGGETEGRGASVGLPLQGSLSSPFQGSTTAREEEGITSDWDL